MSLFSEPSRRRYGVAVFVGIISGIISAFVKWGAEHPFPPRSPIDLFTAACPQPVLDALNAGSITMSNALEQCSRAVLNPPAVFLRDYIGIDPYNTVAFTFADHPFNSIGVTHMIFSLVFAIGYCVVAEIFPKSNSGKVSVRYHRKHLCSLHHIPALAYTTCCRMAFI